EQLLAGRQADTIDIGKRDLHTLLSRDVYTGNTCHASSSPGLPMTVHNTATGQIVWRKFDAHPVAGQDAYKVQPDLAGNMGKDLVTALQFHAEHRIRERFDHLPLDLDDILLRQRRSSFLSHIRRTRVARTLPTSRQRTDIISRSRPM